MFGPLHAARTIASNPLGGTKEVAVGIPFARLRSRLRNGLLVALIAAAVLAPSRADAAQRPPPTPADIVVIFEWGWGIFKSLNPLNRKRWPIRLTHPIVAGSPARP